MKNKSLICLKYIVVNQLFFRFLALVFIIATFSFCAKTGNPEGGPKDEDAPVFVTAKPPYETTNFKKNEVQLYFDEFIKLKDLNKQLIVSPPLQTPLSVTPQNTATKKLKLEILDTLRPNTTYIFNFGNAVTDNAEGNVLQAFKYVFSTGNYIDSLTYSGSVKDAFLEEKPTNISLLLYALDSTYKDSIVYKTKPNYVANTLDTTVFKFTNLKDGNYKLIALKESVNDYIFDPQTEKIGFLNDTISLPRDSILENPIVFFKEKQPYRFRRGKEIYKGKIQFGFEGEDENFNVKLTSKVPKDFKSIAKFEKDKDTLNYWFTPFETDSLNFIVSNATFLDTITVKLRKEKLDSLVVNGSTRGTLHLRDTFFLETNNPLVAIDTSKFSIVDKDTLNVSFKTYLDNKQNRLGVLFKSKPNQKYKLKILPEAITDIYNIKNDTLAYNLNTKDIENYGRITLDVVNNTKTNLILELLDDADISNIIASRIITASETFVFDLLEPKKYRIRAIIDENKNNVWDTGNYLNKIQPEKIIYFNTLLELRANYFLNEIFTVGD
ncbi:Ig-like domain-containing protein [Polaribacter sp.]|nr:Ig-like domain-containing protein [Polaribacter sp.]